MFQWDFRFQLFQLILRIFEICSISRNFSKFWFFRRKNFILRGEYMIEYLSDWDEKWMVREVNTSYFVTYSKRCSTSFDSTFSSTFSNSGKFVDFREISEMLSETLFSWANIWSNICQIEMKSAPLESLDSEVFQAVFGVFLGPFAPDQKANNIGMFINWGLADHENQEVWLFHILSDGTFCRS